MDNKQILDRIDFNESKLRNIKDELEELKMLVKLNNDKLNTTLNLLGSEEARVKLALELAGHKRKMAATILNIPERTLYRKIREYNLYKQ